MYSTNSSHRKGDRTVTEVLAVLVRWGLAVLIPYGVDHRYDLVVDHGGRFVRVQCKSSRVISEDCISFATSSTSYGKARRKYHGEADYFGVFSVVTGKVYFYPVDGTGAQVQLRLTPPMNGQRKRVNMASDFESEIMVPKMFAGVAQHGRAGSR